MTGAPIEYGRLLKDLNDRASRVRQPLNGYFELTSACNLSCRMCYVRHSPLDKTARQKELSASQWLEIARQARDEGMLFMLLTGGEIFLREDFFDLYEPLTRLGLILTLFSNGTLITRRIAERLALAPPNRFEITLYGATAATYEMVTGVPGSYAACRRGIENLLANRITLALKSTLTKHNVHELEDMRQMAADWGVPFYAGWGLSKRPDGLQCEAEDCRLPAEECVDLEASDRAFADDWTEASMKETPANDLRNFYCRLGRAAFVVNPSGDMNACLLLPQPGVSIVENGFGAAWTRLKEFVDSAPSPSPVCLGCDARIYCGRCPAYSFTDNGTLTEPVPYWCEIAKERKRRYERPAE